MSELGQRKQDRELGTERVAGYNLAGPIECFLDEVQ